MITLFTGTRASGKTHMASLLAMFYTEKGDTVCVVDAFNGSSGWILDFEAYLNGRSAFKAKSKLDVSTLSRAYDHLIIIADSDGPKFSLPFSCDYVYNLVYTKPIFVYKNSL